jgi:hypothetical protein
MSNGKVVAMVDEAGLLSEQIKQMTKRLDILKAEIKNKAMTTEVNEVIGTDFIAEFSSVDEWNCTVAELDAYLKKIKRTDLRNHMFTVKKTNITKTFGDALKQEIGTIEHIDHARMTLKRREKINVR